MAVSFFPVAAVSPLQVVASLLASMLLPHQAAMSPLLAVALPLPAVAFLLVAAAGYP